MDRVIQTLESGGAKTVQDVVATLKSLFGLGRKLMIITYNLPVVLHKNAAGRWSASWIEDDHLARTPNSIADDVDTIWVGCITRECINARAADDRRAPTAGATAAAAVPPPEWHSRAAVPLITRPTGGVPGADGELFRDKAVQLPPSTEPPPSANCDGGVPASPFTFSPEDLEELTGLLNGMNIVPVFLPSALHEAFVTYCMSVLRPGLHNVLETGAQRIFPNATSLEYLREGWEHFLAANEALARVVFAQYRDGDVAWVNDYHLSMMPRFLAKWCVAAFARRPPQLFFLHAPFPTSEIFRTLPVRDEILGSILECDVVGFHAFNYARHFLHCAKRLLGIPFQSRRGGQLALDVHGRTVMVAISHVGVEAAALNRWMASEQAAEVARAFAARHAGKIIIAGIDSCQRLSGVALKLLAFERLLQDNKVYRSRVVLVQRCEMRAALSVDMQRTAAELRERVARINAQFGGEVIDYEEAPSFSPTYRVGLFHRADVLLQTPIREGINLLPLEYVYARTQWQIRLSKAAAIEETGSSDSGGGAGGAVGASANGAVQVSPTPESAAAAAAAGGAGVTPAAPAAAATSSHGHHHSGGDKEWGAAADVALPDAALKAISQGMPGYYATLAAPPSALGGGASGRDQRASLRGVFPGIQRERSIQGLMVRSPGTSSGGGGGGASSAGASATTSPAGAAAAAAAASSPPAPAPTAATATAVAAAPPAAVPAAAAAAAASVKPSRSDSSTDDGASSSTAQSPLPPAGADGGFAEDAASFTAPLPPPLRGGCVVLSEFSAASHILNSNLLVNPWNIARVAKEIDVALTLPDHERSFRQWRDYKYAVKTPAALWSRRVISDVLETRVEAGRAAAAAAAVPVTPPFLSVDTAVTPPVFRSDSAAAAGPPPLDIESTARAFAAADRRLLVIDYGGTLMQRSSDTAGGGGGGDHHVEVTMDAYAQAIPERVLDALAGLSLDPRNTVYVVSGKRAVVVEALRLARLPRVGLAAENGHVVSLPHHASSAGAGGGAAGEGDETAAAAGSGAAIGFELAQSLAPSSPASSPAPHSSAARAAAATAARGHHAAAATTHRRRSAHAAASAPSADRAWTSLHRADAGRLAEWARVKARALDVCREYQWRVNGSVAREYDSLVAWDFRAADAEWAASQSAFLAADLRALAPESMSVSVRKGRVELAMRAAGKGRLVAALLEGLSAGGRSGSAGHGGSSGPGGDAASTAAAGAGGAALPPRRSGGGGGVFVLTAGDDVTDEEMFVAARKWASLAGAATPCHVVNVAVGRRPAATAADNALPSVADMQDLIVALYEATKHPPPVGA